MWRGCPGDTNLEDEHFEVVAAEELGMVVLQSLHLCALPLQALPDGARVSADFARLLQQLVHGVAGGGLVLGELGEVVLDALHGALQVDLPLLHVVLVLPHGVQHVDELVQQCVHGHSVHLRVVPDGLICGAQVQAGARCRGRHWAGAGWLLLARVRIWVLELFGLYSVLSHGCADGSLLPLLQSVSLRQEVGCGDCRARGGPLV